MDHQRLSRGAEAAVRPSPNAKTDSSAPTSRLELTFGCRAGQTYLEQQFSCNPLKVLRPFALGDGRVLLQLLNVGPGLLAGDRLELQVKVRCGARAVLVSQAATKLHRMPLGTHAEQTLAIEVEPGGELELYPGLVIPFADSDTRFATTVALARDARFACLESWSMGRVQRGELFAFRHFSSRLRVFLEDRLVYADGLELTPDLARLQGVSEGFSYLANGFWQWDTPFPQPETSKIQLVSGLCGPERGYLRALASDGLALKQALAALVQTWQRQKGVTELPFARLML